MGMMRGRSSRTATNRGYSCRVIGRREAGGADITRRVRPEAPGADEGKYEEG